MTIEELQNVSDQTLDWMVGLERDGEMTENYGIPPSCSPMNDITWIEELIDEYQRRYRAMKRACLKLSEGNL